MFNHFVFSAALTCWFSLAVIVAVFFARPFWWKIFLLYWLTIFFWAFTVGYQGQLLERVSPHRWGWFLHLGCLFIPTIFFHFAWMFSGKSESGKRVMCFFYTITIFYVILNSFTNIFTSGHEVRDAYAYPKPALLYPVYFLTFVSAVCYGTFLMFRHAGTIEPKKRSYLYLFLVIQVLAYTGALDNFLIMADIRLFPLYPYGLYLVVPYAIASIFFSIKYKSSVSLK